jgi:hypothetical protein
MNRRLVFLLIAVLVVGTAVVAGALAAASRTADSPAARAQTTRPSRSVDTLLAQRIDLECLTGDGTSGAPAVVCYKHTAPRSSIYVEFGLTFVKVMRIRGGGLVDVARYRR